MTNLSERAKRILMTVIGVLILGIGAGMLSYSNLGMDPFQVLCHGIWSLTPLDYGTFYMIENVIMLLAIFFWNRKKIGLGTVINLFLIGYVMEFTEWVLGRLLPAPMLAVCAILLATGIVVLCFSSALYFTADLGVSTYDAIALTIGERQKRVPFKYVRIATDVICVLGGWLLGMRIGSLRGVQNSIGPGTIITAFFTGPLITFFNDRVAVPMLYGKKK